MQKNKTQKQFKKIFIILILLAVLGLGFFAFSQEAQAATYYVATNGSDSNDCTLGKPCLTIQRGLDVAMQSGSMVSVAPGTYNESVAMSNAGVTLQCEGDRTCVISPYEDVSYGSANYPGAWTHDGYGVHRKNIGHKAKGCLDATTGTKYKMFEVRTAEENQASKSNWLSYLQLPNAKTFYYSANQREYGPINFWDAIEIMCASEPDGTLWVRYRDPSADVNTKKIYAATAGLSTINVQAADVKINNFEILAKEKGIYCALCPRLIVDNNKIIYGGSKIYVNSDGVAITNNEITGKSYAEAYVGNYPRGPWGGPDGVGTYEAQVLYGRFQIMRYHVAYEGGNWADEGMKISGTDGTVTNNNLYDIYLGINSEMTGAVNISYNSITNTDNAATALPGDKSSASTYTISNNNYNNNLIAVRLQTWNGYDKGGGQFENNATIYVYNNRAFKKAGAATIQRGEFLLFHHYPYEGTVSKKGILWAYHNSISGGYSVVQINNAFDGSLEKTYFVNNIMTTYRPWIQVGSSSIGAFAYNWVSGLYPKDGPGCYNNGTTMMEGWDTDEIHNFIPESSAVGVGCDMTDSSYPFECGINMSSLSVPVDPYDTPSNMGWLGTSEPTNPADVNGDTHVNIKDIQVVIQVIIGAETRPEIIARADVNGDAYVNIKDIQAIIQEIVHPS